MTRITRPVGRWPTLPSRRSSIVRMGGPSKGRFPTDPSIAPVEAFVRRAKASIPRSYRLPFSLHRPSPAITLVSSGGRKDLLRTVGKVLGGEGPYKGYFRSIRSSFELEWMFPPG